MKKSWMLLVAGVALALPACVAEGPDATGEDVGVNDESLRQMCGGFAGIPCPSGKICVDDPRDSCDPANGGADCSGICRPAKQPAARHCKDPAREYVSTDPAECALIKYACASGVGFSDECGCGCEQATCGSNTCASGEYCCNASCGICAPNGGVCTQQACEPTCQVSDCGPALGMMNYLCPDGVTVAGPTGNCIPSGGGCGWEVVSCP